jgi:hypothetical protein
LVFVFLDCSFYNLLDYHSSFYRFLFFLGRDGFGAHYIKALFWSAQRTTSSVTKRLPTIFCAFFPLIAFNSFAALTGDVMRCNALFHVPECTGV